MTFSTWEPTMLEKMRHWTPPDSWQRITTIDAHTGGEPFRIITGGLPELAGDTILERRRFMIEHLDHLRRSLMWEPRGHADMYGCIVTPPVMPEADFGVLFLHNAGYSSMCGHGIIAVTTVAIETGLIEAVEPLTTVRIDAPAGPVTAHAHIEKGRVRGVSFRNVPSFVLVLDQTVDVPGLGSLRYDIAYGGAFYAFVKASDLCVTTTPKDFNALIDKGMAVKRAVMAAGPIDHPFEPDLSFLYGTVIIGPPRNPGAHSSNVCIFADGELDRSPTGTGVSARLAMHFARKEIGLNDPILIESILGSCFTGQVIETTVFGPHDAVIPEVKGRAWITGRHEFLMDSADPFKNGFIFR
jgi:trans-L-3-hydroxyproline dehydratase